LNKIQKIIVATDFSSRAGRAIERGAQLAKEHDAKLYLLHVLPLFTSEALKRLLIETPLETEQRLYSHAQATLQETAAALASEGINVAHYVEVGRAHMEINQYAKLREADLIVMGDQGETFIQEFFLGTTVSKTLSKGSCPLLIVKQAPKGEYKHVLVPVDFSQPSLEALDAALKAGIRASFHVLHVAEVPLELRMKQAGYSEEWISLYRNDILGSVLEKMESIIRSHAPGNVRLACTVEQGRPSDVILQQAQSRNIDLIVIGKRGETELDEALFGSVTKHVLYGTSCDVLVVSPRLPDRSGRGEPAITYS
jgi:nucleotide-binding universal stress UspA family protein